MHDETTDVLIVGGGPAGLVTAEIVASRGYKTLVLEQEREIGCPVHTSGATTVQAMQDFQIPRHLYHLVRSLRVCSPNEVATFDLEESVGCVIDVRGTYRHLASRARDKGAEVRTGTKGQDVLMDGTFVVGCRATQDSCEFPVSSKILVDASGYRASMSKQSELHTGFERYGVGAEYELVAPRCREDEVVLVVGSRYAPAGYAWVFPWGEHRVRVGVGILHADARANPKEHLDRFMRETESMGVDLRGAEVAEYHFGLIPADGMPPRLVGDGIMAVGDAAGQASLVVGEGIRISMQSGKLAGEVAASALAHGRWDRGALAPYERLVRSRFGRNQSIGHLMNVRMARWDDAKWDKQVRLLATVPSPLLTETLLSEFSVIRVIPWLALRPRLWPRVIRFAVRAAAAFLRG